MGPIASRRYALAHCFKRPLHVFGPDCSGAFGAKAVDFQCLLQILYPVVRFSFGSGASDPVREAPPHT